MHQVMLKMADGRTLRVSVPDGAPQIPRSSIPKPAASAVAFRTNNPLLQVIVDSARELPTRLAAVGQLSSAPLPQETLKETLTYLATPVSDEPAVAERERALRNELLNMLRLDPARAAVAVPALVRQAADTDQDPGMRDYALQHLAAWVPGLPVDEKKQAVLALQNALKDPEGTYAGTALLGLDDLSRRKLLTGNFDTGAEARRIVLDDQYNILSRLSAMALVSELHVQDAALETMARRWTDTPSLPLGARRAAEAFLRTLHSIN